MKINLTALALAGLVAAAPLAAAQSSTCSKSTSSQATLAVAGDSTCSAKDVAAAPIPLKTQLASLVEKGRITGLVVDGKTYGGCESACVAEKLVRESLAAKISAHCKESAQSSEMLAANVEKCLAKGVCATNELASLVKAGRIEGVVIGEKTLAGEEAALAFAQIASCPEFQADCRERMKAELAAATAAGEGSKACATLASAGGTSACSKTSAELAAATGECATKSKTACAESTATLASAGEGSACSKATGELAAKTGECATTTACAASTATLASAGDGAGCSKQAGELASKEGDCATACAKSGTLAAATEGGSCSKGGAELAAKTGDCATACAKSEATLASAGGDAECSQMAGNQSPSSCAQLAALIHPTRVAGVVVDGKAYLGEKAFGVVWKLDEQDLGAKISANCAESAKCEKTLAENVQKTLNGGFCMKTELTALLAAGRIDSLIIDSESTCGEGAEASLAKITACPKFQAECRERAGFAAPASATTGATSCAPIGVDVQVAALIAPSRITCVVVDGKSYQGAEAANVVASLVRENLATSIKEKCEASRACEQTLASNVEKAFADGTCAGGQLASLVESGRIQCVKVGDKELRGCEAKAAIVEIVSCETFRAECAQLASAKATSSAAKADCSKPCDTGAIQ